MSTTTAPKAEIKIKTPDSFDGKPENAKRWITSVQRYLDMNKHIYDTEEKKVLFALSYLQAGPAEVWVEDFTETAGSTTSSGSVKGYGDLSTFRTLFLNDFGPANSAGKAMTKLTNLKQSSFDSLTEYIVDFRLLAGRAGITHIEIFRHLFLKGLNTGLMRSILSDDLPTTNDALIKKAISKQANFEQVRSYLSTSNFKGGKNSSRNAPKKRFTSTHDPNAMEVDRMTDDERSRHMKNGLCFKCHQPGHKSGDPKFHPRGDAGKGKGKASVRRKASDDENSKIEEISEEDEEEEAVRQASDF